jgi:hypothetical protein
MVYCLLVETLEVEHAMMAGEEQTVDAADHSAEHCSHLRLHLPELSLPQPPRQPL